ncbi:MAG: baseplate J/gp47 family protein [Janthinobacterium lividum]
MPISFPTLPALRQQARAYYTARLTGADARVRRNSIQVAADLVAGAIWLMYFYLGWLSKQLFVDSAEDTYLERDGRTYGITREGPQAAAGPVVFEGIINTPIPLGSQVASTDGSVQYVTTAAGTIGSDSEVSLPVLCTAGGVAGNAAAGTPLILQTAIAGVLPDLTVDTAGIGGGAAEESDDALRVRILARKRRPPQGGAADDYVTWAKLVAGVTRVWVYPLNRGAGTVDVTFVMDGRADIIPLAADVALVQASIAKYRPVTADALAFMPGTLPVPITVTNLNSNSAATQVAIAAQLAALFAMATPGSAVFGDGVDTTAPGGTLFQTAISGAINDASGVVSFDLTAPLTDTTASLGIIPVLGTLTLPPVSA